MLALVGTKCEAFTPRGWFGGSGGHALPKSTRCSDFCSRSTSWFIPTGLNQAGLRANLVLWDADPFELSTPLRRFGLRAESIFGESSGCALRNVIRQNPLQNISESKARAFPIFW